MSGIKQEGVVKISEGNIDKYTQSQVNAFAENVVTGYLCYTPDYQRTKFQKIVEKVNF